MNEREERDYKREGKGVGAMHLLETIRVILCKHFPDLVRALSPVCICMCVIYLGPV